MRWVGKYTNRISEGTMSNDLIAKNLEIVKKLVHESNEHQNTITDVFMKNFERFADRITKIEIELFGKSED